MLLNIGRSSDSHCLTVVIVNYRTPELVLGCLESLACEREKLKIQAVVVENGSGDGSNAVISAGLDSRGWCEWVTILPSKVNRGFAGGNNFALSETAVGSYVLFLNSDTVVQHGCLDRCVSVLKSDREIGALSCCLLNSDGSVQNTARRFPHPLRLIACRLGLPYRWPKVFGWADVQDPLWDRRLVSRSVDWLGGAFLMVPREVLEQVGGLDEDFFFYGEDVEFCHRVRRAGFKCWYEASVSTIHLGGASSDETRLPPNERNQRRMAARYLEQRKLYGVWTEWFVRIVDSLCDSLSGIRRWCRWRPASAECDHAHP